MKSTSICGTKPRTAPTPATIPSRISPLITSLQFIASSAFPSKTGIPGTHTPYSEGSGSPSANLSAASSSSAIEAVFSVISSVSSSSTSYVKFALY